MTIAIDDELLHAARVKAVQQGTSVNEVCRQPIEAFARRDEAAQERARGLLAALDRARAEAKRTTQAMKAFVDTNVFVYAAEGSDKDKAQRARQLIAELAAARQLVVSTQVQRPEPRAAPGRRSAIDHEAQHPPFCARSSDLASVRTTSRLHACLCDHRKLACFMLWVSQGMSPLGARSARRPGASCQPEGAAMTYLSPELLWLAMTLPLQVAAYLWLLRRRKRVTLRFPNVALVKSAVGKTLGWRRHVPPALLLIAGGVMVVAVARPIAPLTLPSQQQTVILAIDVSGSMQAADVPPNRLEACKQAAKDFVAALPRPVRVGLVAYADSADLVQPPTLRRDEVIAAIARLQHQGGTAIGDGIAAALEAIFPGRDFRPSDDPLPRRRPVAMHREGALVPAVNRDEPVPPGSDRSAAIVLLTDGQNTMGPDPVKIAQLAANRGVKVFTVGYGTKDGEVPGPEDFRIRVELDEPTLRQVAQLTHGEYFHAADAAALSRVYQGLQGRLVMERQDTEVTAFFAAAAALLLMLGAGLSMWWHGRLA